ncbi:hypothetical protein PGTUg99_028553 [Puccinia graminis f. sp. tritici]|uniref:Uncharacterized protein n=1 Tax=Puccinia graminis f. sp. tritici TaxID=56615 RepID=A0A5B0R863_PUCGR|nr:hypothetical protein PGTUg99_028553 [Puccinia graminis f. sp. tritici]
MAKGNKSRESLRYNTITDQSFGLGQLYWTLIKRHGDNVNFLNVYHYLNRTGPTLVYSHLSICGSVPLNLGWPQIYLFTYNISRQTIFYALSAFQLLGQISCKPLITSKLQTRSNDVLIFSRDVRVHFRHRRSPLPQKNKDLKQDKETKAETLATNDQKVNSKNSSGEISVQEAAKALTLATNNVDNVIMVIQNPQSSEDDIRKAAQVALKNEADEDFLRETLASGALKAGEAQSALAIIRDQGPTVVSEFKEIEKNAKDKDKVLESLKKIVLARLQVVAANNDLIGGIKGGDRRLVLKSQISPSQLAVGGKLDGDQKKAVEEARKNLAAQTKKVDEAVAVIQKKGSSPQEIEAAAKEALVQEADEDFAREVLVSAASDAKAAVEALAAVKEHGPSEVIAGFKGIAGDPSNAASVKKNIDLVVKGREKVVPANLKLIELSGGSTGARQADKKLVTSEAGQTPSTLDPLIITPTTDDNKKKEKKEKKAGSEGGQNTSTIDALDITLTRDDKEKDKKEKKTNRVDQISLADGSSNEDRRKLDASTKPEKGKLGTTAKTAAVDDDIEVTRKLLSRLSGPGSETSVVLVGSAPARVNAQNALSGTTTKKDP